MTTPAFGRQQNYREKRLQLSNWCLPYSQMHQLLYSRVQSLLYSCITNCSAGCIHFMHLLPLQCIQRQDGGKVKVQVGTLEYCSCIVQQYSLPSAAPCTPSLEQAPWPHSLVSSPLPLQAAPPPSAPWAPSLNLLRRECGEGE